VIQQHQPLARMFLEPVLQTFRQFVIHTPDRYVAVCTALEYDVDSAVELRGSRPTNRDARPVRRVSVRASRTPPQRASYRRM